PHAVLDHQAGVDGAAPARLLPGPLARAAVRAAVGDRGARGGADAADLDDQPPLGGRLEVGPFELGDDDVEAAPGDRDRTCGVVGAGHRSVPRQDQRRLAGRALPAHVHADPGVAHLAAAARPVLVGVLAVGVPGAVVVDRAAQLAD